MIIIAMSSPEDSISQYATRPIFWLLHSSHLLFHSVSPGRGGVTITLSADCHLLPREASLTKVQSSHVSRVCFTYYLNFFLNFVFILKWCMCVCVYECKCTWSPAEGVRAPEDGVIGSCRPLTTGHWFYATTEHTRNCWAIPPAPWTFFIHYLQQLFIRYTCK